MLGMSSEPSTQWQEDVAPDEDARFTRLAEQLRELQRRNARSNGAGRALHRKGHVGVEASFEVLDGLPAAAHTFTAHRSEMAAVIREARLRAGLG
jgi:hypothetical protein